MKLYITAIFLVFTSLCFSQINKEKVVIVFDNSKNKVLNNIFTIENQTFRYNKSKNKKIKVKYSSISKDVCTIADLNTKIIKKTNQPLKKNAEFYYSEFYNINIYVQSKEGFGYLYPVERVWLVEGSIKD